MKKRDLIIKTLILANIICLILKYIEWGLLDKFELYPVYTQSIEEELIIIKKSTGILSQFIITIIRDQLIWAVIFFVLMCFKNKSEKTENTPEIKGDNIKSLR